MENFVTTFVVFAVAIYILAQTLVRGRLSLIAIAVLAALAALLLPGMQYVLAQDLITAGAFFLFLVLAAQVFLRISIACGLTLVVVAWLLGALFLKF